MRSSKCVSVCVCVCVREREWKLFVEMIVCYLLFGCLMPAALLAGIVRAVDSARVKALEIYRLFY